jgi:hypothetical protein
MKKILFTLVLLAILNTYAQEKEFVITNEGYSKFVVEEIQNLKKEEIYSKALDWVLVTYKNPDKVITAKKENELIRVNGINEGNEILFEIAVKDGKYKFDLLNIEIYVPSSQYVVGGWGYFDPIKDFNHRKSYLNDEGEVRPLYKHYHEIPSYFNLLNTSLKNYIQSENTTSKSKDW